MTPGRDITVAVERALHDVIAHGPVATGRHVVLASPDQLDRGATVDGLGDHHGFGDVIAVRHRPSSEAATRKLRVDDDLLGLQAGDLRSGILVAGVQLRTVPDLAGVVSQFDDTVHWLHRRVREERYGVLAPDDIFGIRKHGGDIAVAARRQVGLLCERLVVLFELRAAALLGTILGPGDLERVAALLRRPEVVGDNRNAARDFNNVGNARYVKRRGRIKRFDRCAKLRRVLDEGRQHAGARNIQRKHGAAIGLCIRIEARQWRAN